MSASIPTTAVGWWGISARLTGMSNRIVITTDYLHPGDTVDKTLRDAGLEPVYSPAGQGRSAEETRTLFAEAVGTIAASEPVTREMLSAAANLKVIARAGVGYDNVDTSAAAEFGVRVCNTPGVNHHAVAEMTLGLMLTAARNLDTVLTEVAMGGWPRTAGTELRGKTLGVIGYGPSGKAIGGLGVALGMRVLVSTAHPDPQPGPGLDFADFAQVSREADYLTLHARATGRPVIDAEVLAGMKPTAVLVNTARGSLVDEAALADALQSGAIGGAALDVLADEPITADNPLLALDNVWIASHLAGQTVEARERAGIAAAQAVIDVLAGREPASPVV